MKTFSKLIASAAVVSGLLFSGAAQAKVHAEPAFGGVKGAQLFVQSTGTVSITYLGSYANNINTLFLDDALLFSNLFTRVGKTVSTEYEAGDELVFKLNTIAGLFKMNNFYSGPAANNADDFAHASVIFNEAERTATVGFEDLWQGGDKDYNDLMFKVTNVGAAAPIPEPTELALLAGGLGLLVARARTKAKA